MNKTVAIERCSSYEHEKLYAAIKKTCEAAGFPDVSGKTVLLKPNIVFDAPPEKAVSTHPAFLAAVVRLVKEAGAARVIAGDSPGLEPPGFTAKKSRLGEAAEAAGAEWVPFLRGRTDAACPEGRVMKSFTLAGAAGEADVIISLPKLKTHELMFYTGALKNQFGLVQSAIKSTFHVRFPSREAFAAMIVDLNLAVKPAFAIMDAVIGMEGPGPGAGYPREIGLVLASQNFLAMDVAACEIIGYPPQNIPICAEALSRGRWLNSYDEVEYPLLKPADIKIENYIKVPIKKSNWQLLEFVVPGPLRRFREARLKRPYVDGKTCVRCGDCTRICASKAVTLAGEGKDKHIVFDYARCIRCYCCHEVCPVKAITVKQAPFGEAIRAMRHASK